MQNYSLSYIIATRNRLPYLKILLERLLKELQMDEEIVIVDGNSQDGTKEYLEQLFQAGKIHQFISEPDRNQAHGWNKAMLLAKGILIKKLIDDDVHDYHAISICKEYMLKYPETDMCISNCLHSVFASASNIGIASRRTSFEQWKSGINHVFTFSDVSMLVKKSALSYIGLYDTQFTMIDWEYSLRATFLKANIVYYTGYNSLCVATPNNITATATKDIFKQEEKIGRAKYAYEGDNADISFYSHLKIWVGKKFHKLRSISGSNSSAPISNEELQNIYNKYYQKLSEQNAVSNYVFLA